ncbi:hypothetical protein R3W88_000016 [Solanum pinnatisectum]|uniref:Uncharacterized protein n=1 Tax=Solanum pinnatisectum TaxID=50273 RepID=A0AAV9MGU2_9SOLN|nr:hypothetical protein R3W88_000016 [Solanum pinnatisectum]
MVWWSLPVFSRSPRPVSYAAVVNGSGNLLLLLSLWLLEVILFIPCQMFTASLIFGLLTGGVDYFYAFGYAEPPVSSIYLLVSTLGVFTVGLGERHCIVYSIKADVFLNIGVGIFYIGEGNDMPARKSMDEKMIAPDTLSAILGFSTFIRICYMAMNLHKSIVVLNSIEELDQPFNHDHQPMIWIGKQKGVFVLHLSYGIFSSLPLLYLNLEDKVRIQEGGIVMNGPGPVWANQLNTELRDYVWDSS